MQTFKKTIRIDASTEREAEEIIIAMIEMMKIIRQKTSTADFLNLSAALQKNPALVNTAKMIAGNAK